MFKKCFLIGAAAIAVSASAHAASVDVSFVRISNNAAEDLSSQLLATAQTVAGDSSVVDIIIRNNVGIQSSIHQVYFSNGPVSTLFAGGGIEEQVGTSFTWGSAAPPDLPGGNSLNPAFDVTPGLLAEAKGPPWKGVNSSGDLLRFRFDLLVGVSFADVAAALQSEDLRIGFQIRSIGDDGESDQYVSFGGPPESGAIIPLPGPGLMGAIGLGAVGAIRRRRYGASTQ